MSQRREKQRRYGYLRPILEERARAVEVIAAAVVLAFGVHLLGSYVAERIGATASLWVGVGVIVAALVVLLARVLWPVKDERDLEGFVVYSGQENVLGPHDMRYELGSGIEQYLQAAFAENEAMRHVWETSSLESAYKDGYRPDAGKGSRDLIREAAEYFMLRSLSMHVEADFQGFTDARDEEVEQFSGTDLPDVLLQNRFMRLFGEPMSDRAAFIGRAPTTSDENSEIVSASVGGALYQRFEMVLPRGSRVSRRSPRTVRVEMPRFTLDLETEFDGINLNLPWPYLRHLCGLDPMEHTRVFRVRVRFSISPRRLRLFWPSRWSYYRWIDDWVDKVERQVSVDSYLEDIGYETAETTFRMVRGEKFSRWGRNGTDSDVHVQRVESDDVT